MSDWRDRRSLGLLFFGLFFLLLAIHPFPPIQRFLEVPGFFYRSVFRVATPVHSYFSNPIELVPGPNPPEAKVFAEREADFAAPTNSSLLLRRVLFANVFRVELKNHRLVLDAGEDEGVRPGMAAVFENFFIGIVVSTEPHRSLVRIPTDPNFRLAARTESTRFIASAARGKKMGIELPAERSFVSGEIVFLDAGVLSAHEASASRENSLSIWDQGMENAADSVLGVIHEQHNNAHRNFSVEWGVDIHRVQAVWLLEAHPKTAESRIVVSSDGVQFLSAQACWRDLAPRSEAILVRVQEGGPTAVQVGAAVIANNRLVGRVARVRHGFVWVQSLQESQFERLLLGDDGIFVYLGRGGLKLDGLKDLREGWLYTACGEPGIPKGIVVGRVKKQENHFSIEARALETAKELSIAVEVAMELNK